MNRPYRLNHAEHEPDWRWIRLVRFGTDRRHHQNKLGVDISRVPPIKTCNPFRDLDELSGIAGCECTALLVAFGERSQLASNSGHLHTLQLSSDLTLRRTILPHLRPVYVRLRSWSCTYHLQHPFGGVRLFWTRGCPMRCKVIDQSVGSSSYFSKVDGPTTFCEKQESIESLK